MDYREKSREELLDIINNLQSAYDALKEFYERDSTLLKDAEEQKRRLEEISRKAFLTSPDSININRLSDGLYVSVNEGFLRIVGYTEEEVLGKTSLELNIWDDPDRRKDMVAELKNRGKVENFEANFRKKDGQSFPGLMSASLLDIDGVPHILNVTRDITDLKRKEQESRALVEIIRGVTTTSNLDELLRLIHRALGDVVYAENFFIALHDRDTGLFSFPYFVDKYDSVPPPLALEKSCTAYVFRTVIPFLFTRESFQGLLNIGEVEQVGTPSPSWIGIPLQIPSRVTGVLVLQHYEAENVYSEDDLTFLTSIASQIALVIERKKTEEEIKVKNDLLQLVNAEKDKFLSIIAHDLRGPLSAFVSATQILTEEINNMSAEEIRDITISMKDDATSVYALLENLLEWSRLQRGVMDFRPERIKIAELAERAIQSASSSSRAKHIDIRTDIGEDLSVFADRHMAETVLRNLVSNAVKFTPKEGKIKIAGRTTGDGFTEINVSDAGIGMNEQLISKLFLINEKTSRPGTEGEPSSGLGLLLCREFVEKNGGSIVAESKVGVGSSFIVKLPE